MSKGWGAAFLTLIYLVFIFGAPQFVQAAGDSIPGPDAKGFNWLFDATSTHPDDAVEQQLSQVTFAWKQPGYPGPTGFTFGYSFEVAGQLSYEAFQKRTGGSFKDFCGQTGSEWQKISFQENDGSVLPGINDIIMTYNHDAPVRYNDARAKGMYFRLVLNMRSSPRDAEFQVDEWHRLWRKTILTYSKNKSRYTLACDNQLFQPTISADPSKDTSHLIRVSAYQTKADNSTTDLSGAVVTFKTSPGNKEFDPHSYGGTAESPVVTPSKAIKIDQVALDKESGGETQGYTVIVNPKDLAAVSKAYPNDDDRHIQITFAADGTAKFKETTYNDPGINQSEAEDAAKAAAGENDCGKYLGFSLLNKPSFNPGGYLACQMIGLLNFIVDKTKEYSATVPI